MSQTSYVLRLSCPDRVGVVATVTSHLASRGANILEAHHFLDTVSNRSVMRIVFETSGQPIDESAFSREFGAAMQPLGIEWSLRDQADKVRVVIAVSKHGHCLNSLLHRWSTDTLPINIVAVVSNHEEQRRLTEWHGLPFHHLPITPGRKEEQERRMLDLFAASRGELLVLARYMQVLDEELCRNFAGKILNIHHSFLPSFAGAKPYHQAHRRGVKLIGATCHFVTPELDEGPIVEQDVIRVDHSDTPEDMVQLGKDIEKVVLARGLRAVVEDRVLLAGHKTVVFR